MVLKTKLEAPIVNDKKAEEFINKASKKKERNTSKKLDQKVTLRIPKWLLEAIDQKREARIGIISRNSLIVEELARCFK